MAHAFPFLQENWERCLLGKRLFQLVAVKTIERRVLKMYRERVALDNQALLIAEVRQRQCVVELECVCAVIETCHKICTVGMTCVCKTFVCVHADSAPI